MTMVMTTIQNLSFKAKVNHWSTMVDHGGSAGFTSGYEINSNFF